MRKGTKIGLYSDDDPKKEPIRMGDVVNFMCPNTDCSSIHEGVIIYIDELACFGMMNADNPGGFPLSGPVFDEDGEPEGVGRYFKLTKKK